MSPEIPESFVASLPDSTFDSSNEANLAVQREAMRMIDLLPLVPS